MCWKETENSGIFNCLAKVISKKISANAAAHIPTGCFPSPNRYRVLFGQDIEDHEEFVPHVRERKLTNRATESIQQARKKKQSTISANDMGSNNTKP